MRDSILPRQLNLSELQSLLKILKTQFPDNHLVWLKDLVSFLNVRINPSTPVDSAYRQDSIKDAPLGYLSKPIKQVRNIDIFVTYIYII